ncbi:dTMP kinase [Acetivibrio mesophilus]|uniref:Thymidylate kinase n=1 Tax=Acetivibrio mesophilus TaxID=2487273 RepID=A0A4Q0I4U9_9FIRM|nr:thymidylate kinase [Acetivibrio mesophilus]ODM26844.1 thymidylate kinase [Clostridium sp. Bc-iso-3]RXE59291.1 thymidylate kinase [Acetivibrio mesophilus]HHV28365.1 thymidylate kinase [Clostridium sp.]
MKGKLIIIESGADASGKATQTKMLYERLVEEGCKVRKITFPNYDSDSSALVKMYLNGDFGRNPEDVSPYVASTFYAVDRFASYKTDWGQAYNDGWIILADRYTTSNMVHQAAKIKDMEEKERFLDWLWDFEFGIYKLPVPDCVIFLDMPPAYSKELMEGRANKFTGDQKKDIHERNDEYLRESYNNSLYIAEKYNWTRIDCVENGTLRKIEEIQDSVYEAVSGIIRQ